MTAEDYARQYYEDTITHFILQLAAVSAERDFLAGELAIERSKNASPAIIPGETRTVMIGDPNAGISGGGGGGA